MSLTAPPSARQNPGQWPEHRALRPTGHSLRDTLAETSQAPGHLWEGTHTHCSELGKPINYSVEIFREWLDSDL